jgi:hypothetical protein
MERGNAKHGRIVDEQMDQEVRGILQGGGSSRTDEANDPEAAGDEQSEVSWEGGGARSGGAPVGMTADDVEDRSRLGRYIPRSSLPGNREDLVVGATELLAPDDIIDMLKNLPSGEIYGTVSEIWAALGHPNEEFRN